MLNLEEILNTYPASLQRFKRFLLREYLQYKILEVVFSESKYANRLCFLGGTCLRIVYNNNRFSEDLDFDHFGLSTGEFDKISSLVEQKLQGEGFAVEVRNVFKGAYRCYIRFPNLLYSVGLSGHQEEKILIQLDTYAQRFDFEPVSFLLQKLDVFTEIFVVPADLLLAQKCYTILNRKRSKGRDFFDVVTLFGRAKPDYRYLEIKTGIAGPDELKRRLLEVCDRVSLTNLAEDVKPFLFQAKDAKKVEMFDQYIRQVI